jgi:starch-binding outer membrane protein, SusD/RagB family
MRYMMKCAPALLGFGLLAATACHDLTEVPYTEVTDQNFKPTAKDLGSLIAPAYTPLRNLWLAWYGNIDTQEESSDELLTPVRPNGWYDGGTYIRMHQHRWDSHQGQPGSLWGNAFDGINAANRVIYQLESGSVPVDDSAKVHTVAELKAVRAYNYSLLLDNFGNVPIVTDFTSTELPTQSTRAQVYDFVVKELTDAIPHLSDQTGTATYGRMTKWAALGILARVQLNAEVYTGTPHFDQVLALTQQIIDGGKYKLEASYRAPFARTNDKSVENIWDVPYDAINAPESSFHMKTLKPELRFVFNMQAQPWGGSASNPQFIDTYDAADKRLPDTWLIGPQFDAVGHGYNFVKFVPSITQTQFNNGYPVWKYEIYAGETGSSDVDYPILRYAEVLMMKAEALLRTGQADAAAAIVTQVRQRDFPTDPSKATVTGAQLLQGSSYNYGWSDTDGVVKTAAGGTPTVNGGADVKYGRFFDELGWEFAAEGHRRSDMVRFGVYTTKTWFNHVPLGDYHAIFPIPNGVLNTNTNLKQNTGY